jgi:hypothetical protein
VINKLVTSYKYASTDAASTVSFEMENKLVRIEISELKQGIDDFKSDSGLFYEFLAQDIKQISPAISNKFQTLSYFGINPLLALDLVKEMGISGIDRIVPIGQTLDFDLIWDGYELPAFYTRAISVVQTS